MLAEEDRRGGADYAGAAAYGEPPSGRPPGRSGPRNRINRPEGAPARPAANAGDSSAATAVAAEPWRRRSPRVCGSRHDWQFIAGPWCPVLGDQWQRRADGGTGQVVRIRLNQIEPGWADSFRHAVAKHTFGMLGDFLWHRVIVRLMTMHHWTWKDVRQRLRGPHWSWSTVTADGIELINLSRTPTITRYRYPGNTTTSPGAVT